MKITIDNYLKNNCNVSIGYVLYKTNVVKTNNELWDYIDSVVINNIKNEFTLDNMKGQINIKTSRLAYKKLGKDPSRYRVSSEALIRRILQGKGLYKINNVVDTNNLISIETGYSCGSYDLKNIKGDIIFRIGEKGELYQGIGKDMVNIENLPVFSDEIGPYGSPTSDSIRAMVTDTSKEILTTIISFNGKDNLEVALETTKKYLIQYTSANIISSGII